MPAARIPTRLRAAAVAALLALATAPDAGCSGFARLAGKGAKVGGRSASRGAGGCLGASGLAKPARSAFTRLGDDASREALYLADDGAGALSVASFAGDVLVPRADGVAALGDDALTDLYLERSALGHLPELGLSGRLRLWLVDPDGAPRLVRLGADGAAEVATALTKDGEPRMWVRVVGDLADLALEVAAQPARIHDTVIVDADCDAVAGARIEPDAVTALTRPHQVVLLLTEGPLDPRLPEVARIASDDLIAVGPIDVCAPDGALQPAAAAALDRARWASTWGEVWAVGASGEPALVVTDVTRSGDWLALGGDGVVASVGVDEPGGLPPLWVWVLGGAVGVGVGAPILLLARRR